MTDSLPPNESNTNVDFNEHARTEIRDSVKFDCDYNKIKTSDKDIEMDMLLRDYKTNERELVIKTDENFSTTSSSLSNEHKYENLLIKCELKSECTDTDLDDSFGLLNTAPESNCTVKKENDADNFSFLDDSDCKIKIEQDYDILDISDEDYKNQDESGLFHEADTDSDKHDFMTVDANRETNSILEDGLFDSQTTNFSRHNKYTQTHTWVCKTCNIKCIGKIELHNHILSKHRDDQNLIRTITGKYHNSDECSNKTVERKTPFQCKKCQTEFRTKRQLDIHILAKHSEDKDFMKILTNKVYICAQCSYKNIDLTHFKRHQQRHRDPKERELNFLCKICNIKCNEKVDLDGHILSKHPEDQNLIRTITSKSYHCDKCSYKTVFSSRLKLHLQTHLNTKERKMPFQCDTCQIEFRTKRQLDAHILASHSEDKNMIKILTNRIYICDQCSYKTVVLQNLQRHQRRHRDAIEKNLHFLCKACNIKCVEKVELDSHILSKHPEDQNLIRTVTSKCHYCDKCSYKTVFIHRLKLHLQTHVNLKERKMRFQCQKCQTEFRTKRQLDAHILAKHSEDEDIVKVLTNKVFLCEQCSYKCIDFTNFKRHQHYHRDGQ